MSDAEEISSDALTRSVPRRWPALVACGVGIFITLLLYVWIVSAGTWVSWPEYTHYHQLQASAFLHGQVSLLEPPDPRLLALPDPYDFPANEEFRIHDLTLFNGRYYLYWGPVPALIVATANALLRIPSVPDHVLTFLFMFATLIVVARFVAVVRRTFWPNAGAWTLTLGVLVFGFANPSPFMLCKAAVYEAALASGQFFVLLGLLFALAGVRGRRIGFALAGVCWALAMGSRVSLLPAIAVLFLLAAIAIFRRGTASRVRIGHIAVVAAPLIVMGIGLLAYNRARFGSFLEFGQRYQLAGLDLLATYDKQFSTANVLPNLYTYLLRPLVHGELFPFVAARSGLNDAFPASLRPPAFYYGREAIAGILITSPFIWLSLASFMRRWRDSVVAPGTRWLVASLASLVVFSPIAVLVMSGAAMRYMAESTYPCCLLAIIGFWKVDGALREKRVIRAMWNLTAIALAVYTAGIGLLVGVAGTEFQFAKHSPGLMKAMMETTYTGGSPRVTQVSHPIGLDRMPDGSGYWIGQSGAVVDIMVSRGGRYQLHLDASVGGCLDGRSTAEISFASNAEQPLAASGLSVFATSTVAGGSSTPTEIDVPLRLYKGLNRIFVFATDPPTHADGPEPDGCRRMVGIGNFVVTEAPQ